MPQSTHPAFVPKHLMAFWVKYRDVNNTIWERNSQTRQTHKLDDQVIVNESKSVDVSTSVKAGVVAFGGQQTCLTQHPFFVYIA